MCINSADSHAFNTYIYTAPTKRPKRFTVKSDIGTGYTDAHTLGGDELLFVFFQQSNAFGVFLGQRLFTYLHAELKNRWSFSFRTKKSITI